MITISIIVFLVICCGIGYACEEIDIDVDLDGHIDIDLDKHD